MNFLEHLNVIMRSNHSLINVVTYEENRFINMMAESPLFKDKNIIQWDLADGFKAIQGDLSQIKKTDRPDPLVCLREIDKSKVSTIFILRDFHHHYRESIVVRALRNLHYELQFTKKVIIILTPAASLPLELREDVLQMELPLPTYEEIEKQLESIIASTSQHRPPTPQLREKLVESTLGLSLENIKTLFAQIIITHNVIDERAIEIVLQEKRNIIQKGEILEFFPVRESLNDIGGLENLKKWLRKRSKVFTRKAKDYGLPAPKGILIIGIQGTGKSLTAKATAGLWKLPLLRMDLGKVFGSLLGESEGNLRNAIRLAETISPCILWVDELEKAFAGSSGSAGDSGTSARILGTFLTWMQEKTKPVFIIATGNDITLLPPELMRKGRFDEIFFVDLPSTSEREAIFKVHLEKVRPVIRQFDLEELAGATDKYSGAEIEQIIYDAMFTAFDDNQREFTADDIKASIQEIIPISRFMKERIEGLRQWAVSRTRKANSE
ncbi:MAG: AAA family ATPase [Deltaproteobacteria bacterium]|nr:AAA family ATPase [Candidatus Anaeroferrophillus wilburensis]MBN2887848.1 AAA family ATPase [Deltaproteobacteria bacterium]